MAIIDILSHMSRAAEFTVDLASNFVPLLIDDAAQLKTIDNKEYFEVRDNFTILSFGCQLPLGFEFYQCTFGEQACLPNIKLRLQQLSGGNKYLFNPDTVWLPFGNYEMSYNNFFEIPVSPLLNTEFALNFVFNRDVNHSISMINVPDDLDGQTFPVPIFAKIMHTLPLINPS